MPGFQIHEGTFTKSITEMCLDSNLHDSGRAKKTQLEQIGWDSTGKPFDVGCASASHVRVRIIDTDKRRRATRFEVEAVPGAMGTVDIFAHHTVKQNNGKGPGDNAISPLKFTVGPVTRHQGMVYDLFADLLGKSENPIRLNVYQRALAFRNNELRPSTDYMQRLLADQPLKQTTGADKTKWDCGAAASRFGHANLGPNFKDVNTPIYTIASDPKKKRPNAADKEEIHFDSDALRKTVWQLRNWLSQDVGCRLFAAHHYPVKVSKGVVQQTGNTHFLSIIGCDLSGKFLFLDPWPGGAQMIYNSGIFGNVGSSFMGVLQYYPGQAIETSAAYTRGGHRYMVLTGP